MTDKNFFRDTANAIVAGDPEFFKNAQLGEKDRRSLLTIQNIVRLHAPAYTYLEVGSAMGGSLFPHLADPACRLAYSVDIRPASQPDERGRSFNYENLSTAKMLTHLQQLLPLAAMLKLHTFDVDAAQLTTEQIGCFCDLIFIDGEHTNVAVFRDFMNTIRFAKPSAVIAFHDANLVFDGIINIECFLSHQGIKHRAFVLPDTVFVILLGDFVDFAGTSLARSALDKASYFAHHKQALWRQIAQNVK